MQRMEIVEGDITQFKAEAIVNAANTTLLGGGGVDGAIHRVAGPELLEECRKLNGCPTGEARLTRGYRMPARYVIHTVGPVWHGGGHQEHATLASCYRNSLTLAVRHGIRTIAFPAISTGVYRFPLSQACRIAIAETSRFLAQHHALEKVTFVCFNGETRAVYEAALAALHTPPPEPAPSS